MNENVLGDKRNLEHTVLMLNAFLGAIKRGQFKGEDLGFLADGMLWVLKVHQGLSVQIEALKEPERESSEVK